MYIFFNRKFRRKLNYIVKSSQHIHQIFSVYVLRRKAKKKKQNRHTDFKQCGKWVNDDEVLFHHFCTSAVRETPLLSKVALGPIWILHMWSDNKRAGNVSSHNPVPAAHIIPLAPWHTKGYWGLLFRRAGLLILIAVALICSSSLKGSNAPFEI